MLSDQNKKNHALSVKFAYDPGTYMDNLQRNFSSNKIFFLLVAFIEYALLNENEQKKIVPLFYLILKLQCNNSFLIS